MLENVKRVEAPYTVVREKSSFVRSWIRRVAAYDGLFWRGALGGLVALAVPVVSAVAAGFPTGLGWLHYAFILGIAFIAWGMLTMLTASILTLLRIPVPRLFVSGAAIYYCSLSYGLSFLGLSYLGGAWIAGAVVVAGALLGSSISLLLRWGRRRRERWAEARMDSTGQLQGTKFRLSRASTVLAAVYCLGSIAIVAYGTIWLLGPGPSVYPPMGLNGIVQAKAADKLESFEAPNPSDNGQYAFLSYTYGSGMDKHRAEFASEADWITSPVDASEFLTGWRKPRTWFWGFDSQRLPLNGRVWMPDAEGRFPLVLIVHGSDYMEYFSDTGYDYLGELLASQGFIAVSVDENYINYSTWSGDLDWDMTIRAWLLLQHLHAIQQADSAADNIFSGKVDMNRIALIGHSRGGQAAVLAAEFQSFFKNSAAIPVSPELYFPIESVVAISPIDKMVDGKAITLYDTNYLVIHGAMDGDVNTFSGANQYRRTTLQEDSDRFKASLYIQGANHGQFNTEWGSADITAPTHLLMNRADMLSGEEQRQIAEVYISAFLQATLMDRSEYVPMFKDYRYALPWLPDTTYISRYEGASFVNVGSFQYSEDRTEGHLGVRFQGSNLQQWEVAEVLDRRERFTGNKAALLAWDGEQEAEFTIDLEEFSGPLESFEESTGIAFSLAEAQLDEEEPQSEMDILVEFETEDDVVVHVPLEEVAPPPPPVFTQFTKAKWLEKQVRNGALGATAEAVFQTYELSLSMVSELDEDFQPDRLQAVRLIFPKETSGMIYIDDIGFYPSS